MQKAMEYSFPYPYNFLRKVTYFFSNTYNFYQIFILKTIFLSAFYVFSHKQHDFFNNYTHFAFHLQKNHITFVAKI